jgi:hypothetical protein
VARGENAAVRGGLFRMEDQPVAVASGTDRGASGMAWEATGKSISEYAAGGGSENPSRTESPSEADSDEDQPGAGEMGCIAEMRILFAAAKQGRDVLLHMPNRIKCILLVSAM